MRNFVHMFSRLMCTQQPYQHVISLQCSKVIGITVLPPSDFRTLKNVQQSPSKIT